MVAYIVGKRLEVLRVDSPSWRLGNFHHLFHRHPSLHHLAADPDFPGHHLLDLDAGGLGDQEHHPCRTVGWEKASVNNFTRLLLSISIGTKIHQAEERSKQTVELLERADERARQQEAIENAKRFQGELVRADRAYADQLDLKRQQVDQIQDLLHEHGRGRAMRAVPKGLSSVAKAMKGLDYTAVPYEDGRTKGYFIFESDFDNPRILTITQFSNEFSLDGPQPHGYVYGPGGNAPISPRSKFGNITPPSSVAPPPIIKRLCGTCGHHAQPADRFCSRCGGQI
jgi:hypothetical protein